MREDLWIGLIVGGLLPGWQRRANGRMLTTLHMWRQYRRSKLQLLKVRQELMLTEQLVAKQTAELKRQFDR